MPEFDSLFSTFTPTGSLDGVSLLPSSLLRTNSTSRSDLTSNSSDTSLHHSIGDCDCLATALGLLSKFNSATDDGPEPADQSVSLAQSLIAKNKSVSIAVENILQCSYAQDSQVFIILALVVSKALDGYLRASRVETTAQELLPSYGSCKSSIPAQTPFHLSGVPEEYKPREDCIRTGGQLVLGELHRILKLINGLSSRLQKHGSCHGVPDWMCGSNFPGSSPQDIRKLNTVSFSSTMLNQLVPDLRRQLSTVVEKITGVMRDEF